MKLTRGQFLGLGAATAVGLTSGCKQVIQYVGAPELPHRLDAVDADPTAWRVLSRLSFGARPGEPAEVAEIGATAWIEDQLSGKVRDEGLACQARLAMLDTLDMDAASARDWETAVYPEVGKGHAAVELQQATVIRAVYSERQLQEVMADFWTNHFSITQLKQECSWLKTVDDRLLRPHMLGKFRDLVWASSHSPAMLFYLDNDKNKKKDPKTGSGANENYARELLELHTLGVHGGYTLKDVQEVARCLSGWSYRQYNQWQPGGFVFNKNDHDDGQKTVLGVKIPAGQGVKDGEQVIDLLCKHPSTARYVAWKLVRRFVNEVPPPALVTRIAQVFERTDGDMRQVLSELFNSEDFLKGNSPKLKRPFNFAASAMRAVGTNTMGDGTLSYLEGMGQLPFKWTTPDGYPDRAASWAPGLLARWNFAADLTQNKIGNTRIAVDRLNAAIGGDSPKDTLRGLCRLTLGKSLPEPHIESLAKLGGDGWSKDRDSLVRQWTALLLSSPQFQWC